MKKMARYRSAWALGCHPRIRAGFPRDHSVDRSMARDRPSPYVKGRRFFTVARGPSDAIRACERVSPAISPRANAGEGQALALQ